MSFKFYNLIFSLDIHTWQNNRNKKYNKNKNLILKMFKMDHLINPIDNVEIYFVAYSFLDALVL